MIITAVEDNVLANRHLISGEDLYHMPGNDPHELVNGEVAKRPFAGYLQGEVVATIGCFLGSYLRLYPQGKAFTGRVGVYTGRAPDTVRGFDVAFMSRERFQQIQSQSYLDVAPELIVEVMSPDDSWSGIQEKLAEYFAIDVKAVWVVDPKLKQIHSFHALDDVHIYRIDDTVIEETLLPGFAMPLVEVFEDAL